MIQFISDILRNSSVSGIVSWLIALISLFLTIFTYVRSNRRQNPKYLMWTAKLRSSVFDNSSIVIKHGERTIPELSVSKIAIWNKGVTIKREDVAAKVPLQIVVPDNAEILEVHAVYTDEANNIQYALSENHRKIQIDFDYLAKDDGVVLKFFHTCEKSTSLKIQCALKSGVKISHARGLIMRATSLLANYISVRTATRFLGVMLVILCLVEIFTLLFSFEVQIPKTDSPGVKYFQLALYLFMLFYVYRAFFYRRLPKKLSKAYYEE